MRGVNGSLTEDEIEIYSRQIVLADIGFQGQLKLKEARAAIVGLGGLGCPTATLLASMGVGYLRLVDRDVVEKSNLHRQWLYNLRDVGYPKVEVAARRIMELNPYTKVEPMPIYVDDSTAEDVVEGVDVVLDGLDNISARRALNRACVKLGVPYIFATALQTYGLASTIIPGETPCLECIFPGVNDKDLPTCATVGVHPSILNLVSSIEVFEAVNILTGSEPRLKSKLIVCDLYTLYFYPIDVSRSENCYVCGRRGYYTASSVNYPVVEELCGRGGLPVYIVNPGKMLYLDLENLANRSSLLGLETLVKSALGVTLKSSGGVKVSILRTGIMIVEGTAARDEVVNLYYSILGVYM
jgi:adenylyltransferase/sulfurtransferase